MPRRKDPLDITLENPDLSFYRAKGKTMTDDDTPRRPLEQRLKYLKLPFIREHYKAAAARPASR